MKTKEREIAKWIGREEVARESPLMIQYPGGEGASEHESISRPRAPYPLSRTPHPGSQKMQVHPAMFMKTKERENFARPTPRNWGGDVRALRQQEGPRP